MSTKLTSPETIKTKVKHRLANSLVKGIVTLFKSVDRKTRKRIAFGLASLIFALATKTRKRAMNNIANALPHLTLLEVKELSYLSYKNIVFGVLECFWLDELEFEFELDPAAKEILESGLGVSVATMHMSCYEVVPVALQKLTQRSTTLSKIPVFLECAKKIYLDMGIDCINKSGADCFFPLLKAIKQNQVVSLHSDHHAADIKLKFFGQQTGAPSGAAMLSAYAKTPLLLSYALLQESGKYKVYVETVNAKPIQSNNGDVTLAMEAVYNRFESIICQFPEQWYWSYKRWR